MKLSPVKVDVDLDINLTNSTMEAIHVNQYETNAREIYINVKNDGIAYQIPSDATVRIKLSKPNGNAIYDTLSQYGATISADRTMISFPIKNSITAVYGRHSVDFEIVYSDGAKAYTNKFYINVHKDAIQDDTIIDSSEYKVLEGIADDTKGYMNSAKDSADKALIYQSNAKTYMDNAKASATDAKTSETKARESYLSARAYAEDSQASAEASANSAAQANTSSDNARTHELNAKNYEYEAEQQKNEATNQAKLAQSYSDGSAGVRTGEETDNAKYYANEAKKVETSIPTYIKQIENAGDSQISRINDTLDKATPEFQIDFETGHLMYTGLDKFEFTINETNGHLEWRLI